MEILVSFQLQMVIIFSFFSFPVGMNFIYFSCLIAKGSTSNTRVNNYGDSKQSCLFLYLRGNDVFRFSPLGMILAIGLSVLCIKMVEQKDVCSSFPVRTPKLQLAAEHQSTGEYWI